MEKSISQLTQATTIDNDTLVEVSVTDTSTTSGYGSRKTTVGEVRNEVVLTGAEYDALTTEEKMNGKSYYIRDGASTGGVIQPIIYSDEEREVGVWRDGKPLYQKTFTADMAGQQSVVIPFSDSDIFVIKFECIAHQEGSDGIISIEPKTSGSLFTVETVEGYGIYTRTGLRITRPSTSSYEPPTIYCTVWYTKAADTSGSGTWTPSGVPAVHYSTNEQIVGTWIDGSTLYQKTIHIASLPQTSYDTYQIASNIDKVVDYKGMVFYSNGTVVVIFQTRPDNTNSQFYHDIENDKTFFLRTYRSEQGEAYVTFQYTKTTS